VLECDIETVHPLLLGDAASVPQISRLLEQIGIRRLTPADMIHHHILPTLRSSSWQVSIVVTSSSILCIEVFSCLLLELETLPVFVFVKDLFAKSG